MFDSDHTLHISCYLREDSPKETSGKPRVLINIKQLISINPFGIVQRMKNGPFKRRN
jgi:hypothetical protein